MISRNSKNMKKRKLRKASNCFKFNDSLKAE